MKNIEDVAVIVQARLSSQRCPRKMIRDFNGTTLMDICLSKLSDSTIPNKNIWLSVYEPELIELCSKYPLNIFTRSERSAMSEGSPMTEIYEWWNKIPHKYVVLVNACSPFMTLNTIEKFYFDYCNSDKDGMFGVIEKKNYFWDENNNFLTPLSESVMNTKTANTIKEAAHCLYAGKLDSIGEGIWMGNFNTFGDIELYSMPEIEAFDIDYEWEFNTYEQLWKEIGVK
jgi:CMP-N-acetylneuraminic acid synthetase